MHFMSMSIESSQRKHQRSVYALLIAVGLIAAAISGSVITYISYEYITRPELRDPVPHESPTHHSSLPDYTIHS